MVVADRRNRVLEEAEAVDDARALVRVALHERPLVRGQARRLQEDRIRDRQLADVVEERGVAEEVELGLREPELAPDGEGELLDAARMACGVGIPRVHRRREALHRRGGALLQEPVRLLERDVLLPDGLCGLPELLRRALGMAEVGGHRLAHEEEREDEDREAVEADGRVGECDRPADRAEGDVVRQEPREALVPHAPPLVVPFEGHRAREEARVDDEVRAAGDEAGRCDDELAGAGLVRADAEDGGCGQRCEAERADVEADVVPRVPARAPFDRDRRNRERQRRSGAEERCACKGADRADRDGASLHLERERLAAADEDDDRDQADEVVVRAEEGPGDAGADAGDRDERDERGDGR